MTTTAPAALRILAVDGGQSAIRLRHSDGQDPVEVDGISRGGDTLRLVAEAVERGWIEAGRPLVDRAVLGLTTAATIWTVACLGIACGAGRWRIAALGLVLALVVLTLSRSVERGVSWLAGDPGGPKLAPLTEGQREA